MLELLQLHDTIDIKWNFAELYYNTANEVSIIVKFCKFHGKTKMTTVLQCWLQVMYIYLRHKSYQTTLIDMHSEIFNHLFLGKG